MERKHWSFSQLNTLMTCPLLFYFRYITFREPEHQPDYFHFGSALHEAHKHAYTALKKGRKPKKRAVQAAFADSWEILGKDPLLKFGKRDWADLLNLGLDMLHVFLENMTVEKVVFVDHEFTVPLITPGGEILERPLTGIFDLVVESDDGLTVVDFKTGSKKYTTVEVAENLQATAYCYGVHHSFEGFGKVSFRFDLLTKTKKPAFVSYPTERTERDFTRLVSLFQEAEKEIDNGVFLPRPSWRCRSCSHQGACADWTPSERESGQILTTS
jgi:RecB family exonuclease